MRNVQTRKDLDQALSTFAPEWVGNAPAGETITLADLVKEGEAALSVPPEKRPIPSSNSSTSAPPDGTSWPSIGTTARMEPG